MAGLLKDDSYKVSVKVGGVIQCVSMTYNEYQRFKKTNVFDADTENPMGIEVSNDGLILRSEHFKVDMTQNEFAMMVLTIRS